MRSRDRAMRSLARAVQASSAAASGSPDAEAGMEAEEAQDPQMVLGDALERVADEADVPFSKIVEAAEIVEDLAGRGIGRKRVDGEVAPRRVLFPVVGEGDRRAAAVGRDVAAQAW